MDLLQIIFGIIAIYALFHISHQVQRLSDNLLNQGPIIEKDWLKEFKQELKYIKHELSKINLHSRSLDTTSQDIEDSVARLTTNVIRIAEQQQSRN